MISAAGQPADTGQSRLLGDQAYERIKSMVIDGALPPGTSLSVSALAVELGMSRSPVREAVQRLIHDGLATHVAHRGAMVTQVDAVELDSLYVVKEPLEGLAARLATERMTVDDEQILRELLAQHEELLSAGAPGSVHTQMDLTLHRTVHLIAGNPALAEVLAQFAGRTNLAFPALWTSKEMARLAIDEHRAIVDAMIAGDPDGAERAARRHVSCIRLRWARRNRSAEVGTSSAGRTSAGTSSIDAPVAGAAGTALGALS
jgi:DNA-binding GntR family transcriptional regulator